MVSDVPRFVRVSRASLIPTVYLTLPRAMAVGKPCRPLCRPAIIAMDHMSRSTEADVLVRGAVIINLSAIIPPEKDEKNSLYRV